MEAAAILLVGSAAALKAAAPGPCILVAASRSMTEGLVQGLRVASGAVVANGLLLGLAVAALSGSIAVSGAAQGALRLAGLGLLVAFGLSMLRARPVPAAGPPAQGRLRLGAFALGLALGLTSPLNLVFALAVVPQFVDLGQIDAAGLATLAVAVLIGGALPLVGACLCAARLVTTGLRHTRVVTRLCGVALLGFAGIAAAGFP